MLDQVGRPRPARLRNLIFNVTTCVVFAVIQTLAALALDGWLSVALWVNVARNVLVLAIALGTMMVVAVEAINDQQERAA